MLEEFELAPDASGRFRVGDGSVHEFDGDRAVGAQVVGEEDLSRGAAAQAACDRVAGRCVGEPGVAVGFGDGVEEPGGGGEVDAGGLWCRSAVCHGDLCIRGESVGAGCGRVYSDRSGAGVSDRAGFGVVLGVRVDQRAGVFETTRWSVLDALHSGDSARREMASDALTRQYLPAVYGYLLRLGMRAERAEETAQGFFADVVFTRRLFERADPTVGRLRSLLIRALENYRVDTHRRERARPALNGFEPGVLEGVRDRLRTPHERTPEQVFEQEWALGVLGEACRRCAAYFRDSGREGHWLVFEARCIGRGGGVGLVSVPSMAVLAREHGFESEHLARAGQQVVRRRFQHVLRELLCEHGGPDIEQELAALSAAIGRPDAGA